MEGYYWRFADAASGRAAIVLCGVCRAPDGVWALVALAGHPGGFVRWVVAERARADPDGFGVAAWGASAEGAAPILTGGPDRLAVDLGPGARLEASFAAPVAWPRRSLGALGLAQVAPGLPQYWQPVMLGARVSGSARLGAEDVELGGADAYAEKNWGGAFPAEWWWGQAAFGGGATAAFAGGRLRGPAAASAVVVRAGGELIRFAPPGAIVSAEAGGGEWRLRGRTARHRLLVEGQGGEPHILPVPVVAERRAILRSEHHLAGRLRVRLRRGRRTLLDETSALAALEHGTPR